MYVHLYVHIIFVAKILYRYRTWRGGSGSQRSSMAGLSLQWATPARQNGPLPFEGAKICGLWKSSIFCWSLFHFSWANWIPVIPVVISWSLPWLSCGIFDVSPLSLFPLAQARSWSVTGYRIWLAFRTVCDEPCHPSELPYHDVGRLGAFIRMP